MTDDLRKRLIQLALFILAILVVLVISRVRHLSLKEDFGLVWPSWGQAFFWLTLWVIWVAASEWLSIRLGFPRPQRWEFKSMTWVVLSIIGLVILAPVAEELIFRGLLFNRLRTNLGLIGAILISAGPFAVLHVQYGWKQMAMIFLDGVILGLAYYFSGSLGLAILMHGIGNLYAVYQRLPLRL
jgi:membrane protease YdiL (CAAX protease family)